jgi:peptidase E
MRKNEQKQKENVNSGRVTIGQSEGKMVASRTQATKRLGGLDSDSDEWSLNEEVVELSDDSVA